MRINDKIFFIIFSIITISSLVFSSLNSKESSSEEYRKCIKICKNESRLLKISTINELEGMTCYCETSPGIIDEVKVENGR